VTISPQRLPMGSGWMSIHEASSLMGVSPATLRRWSDAGRIRTFTTPGGHRRFSRAAVAELLPDETPVRAGEAGRVERIRIATDLPWFSDLDPPTRRRTRQQVRRVADALVAATVGRTAVEREFAFHQAEVATTRCAVLAARSGIGLRETVEGLLTLRGRCLGAIADAGLTGGAHDDASASAVETVTDLLDRLLCHAMRAHEAALAST